MRPECDEEGCTRVPWFEVPIYGPSMLYLCAEHFNACTERCEDPVLCAVRGCGALAVTSIECRLFTDELAHLSAIHLCRRHEDQYGAIFARPGAP